MAARQYGEEQIRMRWRQSMGPHVPGVEAEVSKFAATLSAIEADKRQQRLRKQQLAMEAWHEQVSRTDAEEAYLYVASEPNLSA